MMATVPHVTSGLGLGKFQADGFLLIRVYSIQPRTVGILKFQKHTVTGRCKTGHSTQMYTEMSAG